MGFSRQGYWSGLSFPSPGGLPNPGIEPGSPALQTDALPSEPPGKHHLPVVSSVGWLSHFVYTFTSCGYFGCLNFSLLRIQLQKHSWTALWASICFYFSSVVVSDSATPWTAACQVSLSLTNSPSLPKLMFIESVMPSSHLILCRPLLLPPSIFPNIRVFSNESALPVRWPKYWSYSFNISPSNEHPELISFRMDPYLYLTFLGHILNVCFTL